MKHGLRCFLGASLAVIVVGLAGCGPAAKSGTVPGSAMGAPAANPPSVAQPVPTSVAGVASTPVAPMGDTAGWKTSQHTAGTLTYSYLYPAGWTPDLSYCAAGSAMNGTSNELPAGCVSTDILFGQKAADLGTLSGESLTINGKQAVKQITDNPRNTMASRIYTLMLYDATGAPLVGFSSSIGPGTDEATQTSITDILDKIAATLTVGR
jgi:hypothetical protein